MNSDRSASVTRDKILADSQAEINDRDYESATVKLENLLQKFPNDLEIQIKLFHAYAGAGTFEAMEVVAMGKKIEKIFKSKPRKKIKVKMDLESQVLNLEKRINKILSPLPDLTRLQSRRLDQAIELYQKIGLEVEKAGKYNNFKWGTIHLYRLAINAKVLMKEVSKAKEMEGKFDTKKLERAFIPKLAVMGQDIFVAYRLFGNSYDKLQKITKSIDKLISKSLEDANFKLKIDETITDQTDFFLKFISDNIHATTILVKKITDLYSGPKLESLGNLSQILPQRNEIKESEKRIEMLIKVFLRNFSDKHPEVEDKINELFNDAFRANLTKAIHSCIEVKNTSPLKDFIESKQHEVKVIISYYRLLRKEIKESELEESIKRDLEPLSKKISLELLKEKLKDVEVEGKNELEEKIQDLKQELADH